MYMVALSTWNLEMHSVPLKEPKKKKKEFLEFSLDLEKFLFSLVLMRLT